jgi:hypothetical protein
LLHLLFLRQRQGICGSPGRLTLRGEISGSNPKPMTNIETKETYNIETKETYNIGFKPKANDGFRV